MQFLINFCLQLLDVIQFSFEHIQELGTHYLTFRSQHVNYYMSFTKSLKTPLHHL